MRLGWTIQPKDGDRTKFKDLNLQTGLLSSSLESGVPEQMFSTPTQKVQGVSAVAALKLAGEQGQRIYHITKENQAQTLPNLRLDGLALQEIQQGLNAGKEVIAHTDRISVPGFIGEGYIVFDPITGGGAYKITGGGNGAYAFVLFVVALFLLILTPFLLVTVSGGLAIFAAVVSAWSLDGLIKAFQSIVNSNASDDLKAAQIGLISIVSIVGSLFAISKIGGSGLATLEGAEAFKVTLLLFFANFIVRALSG